eukprot:scaffold6362_cov378-Prasinococcus_capsulatus_cf.AAC.3
MSTCPPCSTALSQTWRIPTTTPGILRGAEVEIGQAVGPSAECARIRAQISQGQHTTGGPGSCFPTGQGSGLRALNFVPRMTLVAALDSGCGLGRAGFGL